MLSEDFASDDLPLEEDLALELDFSLLEDDFTLDEDFAELLDCLTLLDEAVMELLLMAEDEEITELEDLSFWMLDEDAAELLATLLLDEDMELLLCCGATTLKVPVTVVVFDS